MPETIQQDSQSGTASTAISGFLVDTIARVCHEANRALCVALGDESQTAWNEAPEWQCESARKGVSGIAHGHITRPEQSHESWLADKVAGGWKWGPVKDAEKLEHPCMVPYDQLPTTQQAKAHLFFAVATTLIKALA